LTKLEAAIAAAELYRDINAFDCSVMVTDAQGNILHHRQAETFKENVTVGQPAPGGAAKKVIETKKPVRVDVPEKVYGVKIRAIMRPIFEDDGTFSGVVGNAINMQTAATLYETAQSISSIAQEMTATAEELAVTASQLAQDLTSVKGGSESVLGEIEKTDDILKFVSDVAHSSNLLGLNAAIEAARAGEHGRGFAVVADEIRKMATNSAESVNNIKTILDSIHSQTSAVVKTIANAAQLGERQAAATEEISATMQQLTSTATEVERIAAKV
jgi:hypothetical protein